MKLKPIILIVFLILKLSDALLGQILPDSSLYQLRRLNELKRPVIYFDLLPTCIPCSTGNMIMKSADNQILIIPNKSRLGINLNYIYHKGDTIL